MQGCLLKLFVGVLRMMQLISGLFAVFCCLHWILEASVLINLHSSSAVGVRQTSFQRSTVILTMLRGHAIYKRCRNIKGN
jgi:hypothetical protein